MFEWEHELEGLKILNKNNLIIYNEMFYIEKLILVILIVQYSSSILVHKLTKINNQILK